ncbi:hypothetical protein JHW43_003227 [Diplocarpon mali]|nr:hypothetical protein JHW43_003227 [Diplocarpon mali]
MFPCWGGLDTSQVACLVCAHGVETAPMAARHEHEHEHTLPQVALQAESGWEGTGCHRMPPVRSAPAGCDEDILYDQVDPVGRSQSQSQSQSLVPVPRGRGQAAAEHERDEDLQSIPSSPGRVLPQPTRLARGSEPGYTHVTIQPRILETSGTRMFGLLGPSSPTRPISPPAPRGFQFDPLAISTPPDSVHPIYLPTVDPIDLPTADRIPTGRLHHHPTPSTSQPGDVTPAPLRSAPLHHPRPQPAPAYQQVPKAMHPSKHRSPRSTSATLLLHRRPAGGVGVASDRLGVSF